MSRGILIGASLGLALAVALGFGLGRFTSRPSTGATPAAESNRQILYWYDPMLPAERYPGPGKSSMGMDLIPKYADGTQAAAGVRIDPARVQNLGVRLAVVERATLSGGVAATGVLDFNARDVAVVQARAAGFVQRVYDRAPGDVVGAGAPLADLLIPEWAGAQGEYLAVRGTGDPALTAAARQRLQLLGMPPGLIAEVERSGRTRSVVTVSTPVGGAIKTLGVRAGMSVMAGQTLAEVNGLGSVWLNAAVPEAMAAEVWPGQAATATLAAYPGETFAGRVTAILPEIQADGRTLTVRIELPNSRGRLRPGMFANVRFAGGGEPALLVPSEAVIRTGRRAIVMLARPEGRYLPAEIRAGREADGRTEVLAGLAEGDRVVASGQFLLDSEASLSGLQPRPLGDAPALAAQAPRTGPKGAVTGLHEGMGRVEEITPTSVTLSHGPITTLQWPAMTMPFRLAEPGLARGIRTGDHVAFAFDQPPAGPTIRRLSKAAHR